MCVRFIDLKKIKHCLSKHTQKTGWSVLKKKERLFFKMMLNKFMLKKNKVKQYQYL